MTLALYKDKIETLEAQCEELITQCEELITNSQSKVILINTTIREATLFCLLRWFARAFTPEISTSISNFSFEIVIWKSWSDRGII